MKRILLLIIVSFLSFSYGKAQINKYEAAGDKHFIDFSFDRAVEKYEKVDMDSLTTSALRNLSDSYRYKQQEGNAEIGYSKLVMRTDNKAEDLFMYAELLLMNKKNEQSEVWMEKFHNRLKSDGRGISFTTNRGRYKYLAEDLGKFKIKNLKINTNKEDFGTAFYGDKIVFASSRGNKMPFKRIWNWSKFPYLNVYIADRLEDSELEDVKLMDEKINKKYHEATISFSEDESLMVYTRNNYEGKSSDDRIKLKMFYKLKENDGSWGKSQAFHFNNDEYSVGHPSLTADGNTLYFTSDMPGGIGGTDLYKTVRTDTGWTVPVSLGPNVNTEGNEMFPFIHENEMLFFASNGHFGLGGLDIFIAEVTKDGKVYSPNNLGYPINDSKDDFAFILNRKQTQGYFSSNRPGGKGSDDIYAFDLKQKFCYELAGKVINEQNEILPGATVKLFNSRGKVIEEITVGDSATYKFCLDEGNYQLEGAKENYIEGKNSAAISENNESLISNLILSSLPEFSLVGSVTDKKTKEPLNNVNIEVRELDAKKGDGFTTSSVGKFTKGIKGKRLGDSLSYEILLSKTGYFTKRVVYSKKLTEAGAQYVESDMLALDLMVTNLGELIDLKNINFNFNKSDIRKDAAIELDKIVEVMNRYPEMVVELGSHTDCRASRKYNVALSERRAKSSAGYIKARISNPERIYGYGYGEERLLNDCACEPTDNSKCTEAQHFENRRTEFVIMHAAGADVINDVVGTRKSKGTVGEGNPTTDKEFKKASEGIEKQRKSIQKYKDTRSSAPNNASNKKSNYRVEGENEEDVRYIIDLQKGVIKLQEELLKAKDDIIKLMKDEDSEIE